MLYLTLDRDDYIMIGSTRLRYARNKGSNAVSLEVLAPEGVNIARDKQYEALLTRHADEGDARASLLLEQMLEKKETRRQLTAVRKARHLAAQGAHTRAV